jgi:hypothetical protein
MTATTEQVNWGVLRKDTQWRLSVWREGIGWEPVAVQFNTRDAAIAHLTFLTRALESGAVWSAQLEAVQVVVTETLISREEV